jgi:hypothetical protein
VDGWRVASRRERRASRWCCSWHRNAENAMKDVGEVVGVGGLLERFASLASRSSSEEAVVETYVGLDLSRKRLDWHAVDRCLGVIGEGSVSPQGWGLASLVRELGASAVAVIESMNGARFVHDQLELAGWEVRIADALKVKGVGAACVQDGQDRRAGARRARRA